MFKTELNLAVAYKGYDTRVLLKNELDKLLNISMICKYKHSKQGSRIEDHNDLSYHWAPDEDIKHYLINIIQFLKDIFVEFANMGVKETSFYRERTLTVLDIFYTIFRWIIDTTVIR